jgi:hypothetical protein
MPNENAELSPGESSGDAEGRQTGHPTMARAEVDRSLDDARKLFEVAHWVHAHRVAGSVDSAVFAHRALTRVLGLLVELHGDPVPDDFEKLVTRARAIARVENLTEEDAGSELAVIEEMRKRAVNARGEASPADERRYDHALTKSSAWLGAVQTYADQRLPKTKAGIANSVAVVLVVAFAFAIGVVVGQRLHGGPSVSTRVDSPPVSPSAAAPAGPAFEASFYRGVTFGELVYSRRDATISFNWGSEAPGEGLPMDDFSVRWDGRLNVAASGKYTFFLTSDDGSRLFVDRALAIDNWGNHSETTKVGTVELEPGVHDIRVEFFDRVGTASVRLEWSSERFERRLVGPPDLR